MPRVNVPRQYSSALRQSQTASTRRSILDAARELFAARGYRATTLDQIAARAGVSKPTVFSAAGNKQTLLRLVRDIAIAGDDDPVSVAQRPIVHEVRDAPDLSSALALLATHLTGVATRYAAIYDVLRAAASGGEEELRELWETEEEQRLSAAGLWVDLLRRHHRALSVDRGTAVDRLWFLMAPDHFNRFVTQRHWSEAKYRGWLTASLAELFR